MAGIYDVTLAVGASTNLAVLGSFVKVIAAQYGALQVKVDGGDSISLLEGQGWRLPDGVTFRDVQVRNLAQFAQTVTLFIGDSRFEDSRIAGSVRVIDNGVDRTLLGAQFCGTVRIAANPTNMVWAGIRATTRQVSVRRVMGVAVTAGFLNLGFLSGPPTTGTYGTVKAANKVQGYGFSQLDRGTLTAVGASFTGTETPGLVTLGQVFMQANTQQEFPLSTPLLLPAGTMLIAYRDAINLDAGFWFDVEELV